MTEENFLNIYFPADLSCAIKATIEFSTEVNVTKNKTEFRNQNWLMPRLRYEITGDTLSKNDFNKIKTFFYLTKGRCSSFYIKDPIEILTEEVLGVGDGVKTSFDIFKSFSCQNFTVKKPVIIDESEDYSIYINSAKLIESDFSINDTVLILNKPLKIDDVISISAKILTKVRFDQDIISSKIVSYNNFVSDSIFLQEIL